MVKASSPEYKRAPNLGSSTYPDVMRTKLVLTSSGAEGVRLMDSRVGALGSRAPGLRNLIGFGMANEHLRVHEN
ncbi:unnamed protein product [Caenorhabditis sp. 36 PRJEB53466]|nr:unnamed protein product [Caenorhabditis sp. 36 PRJEB53466]